MPENYRYRKDLTDEAKRVGAESEKQYNDLKKQLDDYDLCTVEMVDKGKYN